MERAFTFVVYFAERSEIARGHLESGVIVNACAAYAGRVLYIFCFSFSFFFHKEERSTEYLLLMSEHRETIFKQCSQPSTDNAASLKASLIERKKELYISTYVYVFTSPRWKEKQITSTHFRLFLAYFYNKCVIMYNKSISFYLIRHIFALVIGDRNKDLAKFIG